MYIQCTIDDVKGNNFIYHAYAWAQNDIRMFESKVVIVHHSLYVICTRLGLRRIQFSIYANVVTMRCHSFKYFCTLNNWTIFVHNTSIVFEYVNVVTMFCHSFKYFCTINYWTIFAHVVIMICYNYKYFLLWTIEPFFLIIFS